MRRKNRSTKRIAGKAIRANRTNTIRGNHSTTFPRTPHKPEPKVVKETIKFITCPIELNFKLMDNGELEIKSSGEPYPRYYTAVLNDEGVAVEKYGDKKLPDHLQREAQRLLKATPLI